MITPEQSQRLKDYFAVQAHEFLNGNTYLTEESITDRLDEVDPSWEFHKLEIRRDGLTVTAIYRMTVCGVSRDGVGMASVQLSSKDQSREVNEAEKSAATDVLKRCARLFGIGRYILEMPKSVTDHRSLGQWLAAQRKVNTDTGEIKLVQNGTKSHQEGATGDLQQSTEDLARLAQKTPQERLGTPPKQTVAPKLSGSWEYDLPALMAHPDVAKAYPQYEHRANAIKKLHGDGHFENVANISEAVKLLINRPDKVTA